MLKQDSLAAALALALAPAALSAPQEAQRLFDPQGTQFSRFGEAVALFADTAVVGHPEDPEVADEAGSAVVFERVAGTWTERIELQAPDAAAQDHFGHAVALSGSWIAVGAPDRAEPGVGQLAGGTYLYRNVGGAWTWFATLPGGTAGDAYGSAVGLQDDLLVVGAPNNLTPYADVFRYDGLDWVLEDTLVATGASWFDRLGASLAVYGDTIVLGAPGNFLPGFVVPFELGSGGWVEGPRLGGSLALTTDLFATSLALWEDRLVVGAPAATTAVVEEGVAYVFERSGGGWTEVDVLESSTPTQRGHFGESVALVGSFLAVGATDSDLEPAGLIEGFVHRNGAFGSERLFLGAQSKSGDLLGSSVATDGARLLAGAPVATVGPVTNANSGTAYDPLTDTLYGYSSPQVGTLIVIEPNFASYTIGKIGFANIQGLAFDAGTSTLYGVDVATDQLITIDTTTGAGTAVGPLGFANVRALAMDSSAGVLYGLDSATKQLISIDPATGAGTAIGPSGFVGIQGLAFDAGTGTLYGIDGATSSLLTLDVQTGAGSVVGPTFSVTGWCLAFDDSEQLLHGMAQYGPPVPYTIDPATGDYTLLSHLAANAAGEVLDFALDLTTSYCTAGVSGSGCTAAISGLGTPSATADDGFQLSAVGVDGGVVGLFYFGASGRQAQPWGNSSSVQCVIPPLARTGVLSLSGSTGSCDGFGALDLNGVWCPSCPKGNKNPGAGSLVQAQLWYRDPASTSSWSTSLSDALEFLVGP